MQDLFKKIKKTRIMKAIQQSDIEVSEHGKKIRAWLRMLRKNAAGAKIALAGSIAKGTNLKNDADVDIFMLFPKNVAKKHFYNKIRLTAKKTFPQFRQEMRYAEHPYVRVYANNERIDLVPAYDIKKITEKASSVDRSILHTSYVVSRLKKRQVPEVLLLKKFLKAASLYGAEIRVEGFSGYLCELLILYYGSFLNTIKAFSTSKISLVLNLKKNIPEKERAWLIKKFPSQLIVIDPVDPNRNVASSLSMKNFMKFRSLCKSFLKHPKESFFMQEPLSFQDKIKNMKKKGTVCLIEMTAMTKVSEDILWGQLKKTSRALEAYLKKYEFEVKELSIDIEGAVAKIAIYFKKEKLPALQVISGPPVELKKNITAFRRSHPKAVFFVKNKKVYARIRRKVRNAKQALGLFFKSFKLPSHLMLKSSHSNYPDYMLK